MPDSVGTAVFARPRPFSDCSGFSKNSRHRIPTAPHRPRVIVWHNCARQNPRSMFCQETPSSSALFLLVPLVSPFGTFAPDGTSPFIPIHPLLPFGTTESSLVSPHVRRHQLSQLRPTEPSVIVLQENSSIHFRTGFRCPPCITDLASGLGCA